ncbi:MAG: hypothetical protein BMS9Abin33_1302 [Gammaproteobacteria bacterium]|nr:MAG: hypothetical protein BMS9Abin33_1302 [Gammaproteobacteria bacterium]
MHIPNPTFEAAIDGPAGSRTGDSRPLPACFAEYHATH